MSDFDAEKWLRDYASGRGVYLEKMLIQCADELAAAKARIADWERSFNIAVDERIAAGKRIDELTAMYEEAKTSWEQANEGWFQADKRIAELEAEHEAVEPSLWLTKGTDGVWYASKDKLLDSDVPLYTQPPSTQAAVSAALRKAAEVIRPNFIGEYNGKDDRYDLARADMAKRILAMPHDDSALRELMMLVAKEVYEQSGYIYAVRDEADEKLQAIVDSVLKGE